jgi:hypothetical protein
MIPVISCGSPKTEDSLEGLCKHETLHIIRMVILFSRHVVNARNPTFNFGGRHPGNKHLPSFFLPFLITSQTVPIISFILPRLKQLTCKR